VRPTAERLAGIIGNQPTYFLPAPEAPEPADRPGGLRLDPRLLAYVGRPLPTITEQQLAQVRQGGEPFFFLRRLGEHRFELTRVDGRGQATIPLSANPRHVVAAGDVVPAGMEPDE
jgi:hypothetical protein